MNRNAAEYRPFAIFLLYLGLALLLGLGDRALVGSEDRWAEIARNMLHYRDWFHPIINGEVYFDKPLLSYWPIAAIAAITGSVDEFAARLPSALAGVLLLWSNFQLASRLWDRQVAWLATWLTATCFGFLFWSHTAAADLANGAFVIAACAWFIPRRQRRDLLFYLVFYGLCAVGAQMKGLVSWVVTLLAVAPFALRDRAWLGHFNLAHVIAGLFGLGILLLPYLVAAESPLPAHTSSPDSGLSGLDLLIRENVVRYLEPFDHRDPVYSYLYHLPRILLPWSLLFIAGLLCCLRRYRSLASNDRALLESVGVIFLFFTVSGSRRWYYILPIMPFCLDLVACYLLRWQDHALRRIALRLSTALIAFLALALLALPGVALSRSMPVPAAIWAAAAVALAAIALLIARFRGWNPAFPPGASAPGALPAALPAATALLMLAIFAFVLPAMDRYRFEKPFALALAPKLAPGDRLFFYRKANTTVVFYLHPSEPVAVVETRQELRHRLPVGARPVLLINDRDMVAARTEFGELAATEPLVTLAEAGGRQTDNSLLQAFRLPVAGDQPKPDAGAD